METINIAESFTVQRSSYDKFAELQTQIENCNDSEIKLCINTQARFGYTFVHLFSTLPFLAQKYNKSLYLSCNEKTFGLFQHLSLIKSNQPFEPDYNYTPVIASNVLEITDTTDVVDMILNIVSETPVFMNDELTSIFTSKSGEMYINALEHSEGKVFGATYFRNKKKTYCFSCYDTGVGIPDKVKSAIDNITDDVRALQWAMISGNSTAAVKSSPRGLGISLLKSFAKANDGGIRICCGKVLYTYDNKNGEVYHRLNNKFHGTLFEMDIIADANRKYVLV